MSGSKAPTYRSSKYPRPVIAIRSPRNKHLFRRIGAIELFELTYESKQVEKYAIHVNVHRSQRDVYSLLTIVCRLLKYYRDSSMK